MNKYGNEVGYHTPETSKEYKKLIDEAVGFETIDTSWHNDVCDSVDLSQNERDNDNLFFPNSKEENFDKEKFNTFFYYSNNTSYKNIDDLIKFLKEKYGTNKHN